MKYQVWKPDFKDKRWVVIDPNKALYDVAMSRVEPEQYLVFGHGISDGTYKRMVEVAQAFETKWATYYPHAKPHTLEITID